MKKNSSLKLCFFLSILLIQTSNQNFLQFDTKTKCPKVPLTSFGILISLSESEDSIYESTLSVDERASYESIVELKRSFASTMSYIPQSFSPEKEEYWEELNTLLIIFLVIALFPTLFIIFYLIVRFILKKCTGPKKLSEVNKLYRNLTWLIMIVSTLISALLFAIVFIKSISVGNNISKAFNFAVESISKSDKAYPEIESTVNYFRNENLNNIPDEKYMAHFKTNILTYIKNNKERTQQILDDESKRTKITAFIFAGFYFLIILAFLFFFLKLEKLECIVSIFLFFSVPSILVLEGYNAKFFFYYGDLCDSVNGALYKNEYPVADKALGYYYNCFNTETKATLYNIKYRLYEHSLVGYLDQYSKLEKGVLTDLLNCEMVSKVIPRIEADFCKESLDHMYTIITLITWIVLTSLGVAIGSRRLQVLIWKKKKEIESMMANQEVLY